MKYRRADTKGGTYFFTVNLAERHKTLLVDHIDVLRDVINGVKQRHPFKLDAMVVLPDHLHAIITLPVNDNNFPTRWRLIKAGFSRQLPGQERVTESRKRKGERGIWQRRYWEHLIRSDNDFEKHVDYIHYNPVKHGYVRRTDEWPYSTIHDYISKGLLDPNWGYGEVIEDIGCGERK